MERCPKCGNKLSNIDVLCPRCGALVEVIQVRSSFIPPTVSATPPKAERPNLIVYNEDLPGEGPFCETPEEDTFEAAPPVAEADALAGLPAFSMPDLSDIQLPEFVTEKESPSNIPDDIIEPQADTRMARRARERQWLELEELNASTTTPEAQLLKEADELTSRSARSKSALDKNRKAESDTPSVIPPSSAADTDFAASSFNEEPERRYRSHHKQAAAASKNVSLKKLPAPAAILLWAMLAAAIFLGFFFLNRYVQTTYGSYPAFIREITNGKIELDESASLASGIDVSVAEAKTESGAPAHTFSVAATGATAVRVLQTGDEFSLEDGKAVFTISDEKIALALGAVTYDNTVKAETLNFDVVFASSTQKYVVKPFDLYLIRSEYKRETPLQTRSSSNSDVVAVSVTVAPGSTVFINNMNYTEKVDDSGKLSVDLKLESAGDNIFAIDVIQPGRQAVKDNFTVTQQASPTTLEAEDEYQRVYAASFECRGTTEAGATLSADINGKTFAGLVSESGAFSAACTVSEYGLYTVKLTAASPDKANSVVEVAVEYLPQLSDFTSKAQKKTVAEAVRNAAKLMDASIKITGKPESLTTESVAQKFSLVSGSSKLECYYYGEAPKLAAGTEYTFYGKLDETGQFYVMFVE